MSNPARSKLARPADGHFVMIPLTKGKFAIVDEADAELVLNRGRWYAHKGATARTFYAIYVERSPRRVTFMHVLIAGRKGFDHVNRNGLDNRRINLRPATGTQNNANQALRSDSTSGFKGVTWHKQDRKWQAKIKANGKDYYLGQFEHPLDAAHAYNQAALEAFGEFAWLNPIYREGFHLGPRTVS